MLKGNRSRCSDNNHMRSVRMAEI